MDYMTTLMASKMKLLSDDSSDTVDAMMYHQMICSLMYLMNMRLDIGFVVNTLRHVHLIVAKHILRYLKGTVDYGLKYEVNQKTNLQGYVDSDWVGSAIVRKSTLGCRLSMGSGVISWFGKMESCMVLSIAEEKYVATCERGAVKLQFVIQIEIS